MWKGFFLGLVVALGSLSLTGTKKIAPLIAENRCMQKLNDEIKLSQARPYCSCVSQEMQEIGFIKIYRAKDDPIEQANIRDKTHQKCGVTPQ